MKKKLIYSLVVSTILFSGCAQRNNALFKKQVDEGIKLSKDINISKDIKQISLKDNFIDFSINKDLKSALRQLNTFNPDNVYILKDDSKNIIFPSLSTQDSKKLDINNFYKLKKFVAETTPYIIKLKTNPFRKGVKIVEVFNKDAVKNNIEKIPISIHEKVNLNSLLNQISRLSGFSIVFKNMGNTSSPITNTPPTSSKQNTFISMPKQFNTEYIDFSGKTIGEFLTYISNQFNLFVNIDYQNKLIIFQKYKTFSFPLIIPNIEETTTASLNKNLNSTTSNTDSLQFNYSDNFIKNFINSLKAAFPNDEIYFSGGTIYAKLTKNDYESISTIINNFNNQFQKKAKIKIDVYAFLVNKNYNLGSDFSLKTNRLNFATKLLTNTILKAQNYSANKNIVINLNNNFLKYVKHYSFESTIINNISIIDDLSSEKNYIESIQTTTTTGTATSTSVQTNIGQIHQGQEFIIFPKIYSNKVFLRILFKTSALDNLEEKNIGENTIMLPTVSIKNIPINATLRYGERKIVSVIQTFANANQFKGIVPLEGFVIGGDNQHQYVRELIAVVISVNK